MRFFEHQDSARGRTQRLLVLFSLAVAATAAGVHLSLLACWWLLQLVSPWHFDTPRFFFAVNVGVTLLLVLGGRWIEVSNLKVPGGAVRLAQRIGAREVRRELADEQRLDNIVDEVCIAAHMPKPQVMVLPRHEGINAFATGWDAEDAVVAVTQGALDLLTREELQGLVAHECSHIHEGDTRLNMELAGMVTGLELVWGFGETVRERGGLAFVFGTAVMAIGAGGWYAGRLLQASVSREREYLADARAVQWTRSRDGLGGVLRKVLTQWGDLRTRPDDPAIPESARHLLVVGDRIEQHARFESHPPLAQRIERIYGRRMPGLPLPGGDEAAVTSASAT